MVRDLERCPGGTPHFGPTRPVPTSVEGDQLSAEREMKCPPTGILDCPLSIMSGLNMGIIMEMPLALPPMEAQRDFVARLSAVESARSQLGRFSQGQDILFTSLQARAFAGRL